MTLDKLSGISHISKSMLIRYENNQLPLSLNSCHLLTSALHVDPHTLFDDYLQFVASDYGGTIRQYCQKHLLTSREYAAKLGVNVRTVLSWERMSTIQTMQNY